MRPIPPKRQQIAIALLIIVASSCMGLAMSATTNSAAPRVIKIHAQRFTYTPNEIVIKANETVTLEFTSQDFVHGFKIPDLNLRADLPPGKTTTIQLTPQKAGEYEFLCDNFCGDGHEKMSGKIIVKG